MVCSRASRASRASRITRRTRTTSATAIFGMVAAVFAVSPLPLRAESPTDLAEAVRDCRQEPDSLRRLSCYDAAVDGAAPGVEEAAFLDAYQPPGSKGPVVVECPLRIEVPLHRKAVEAPHGWTTGVTGAWQCDSGRISTLNVKAERSGQAVEVTVTTFVTVAPSFDRLARVEISLLATGEGREHRTEIAEMDAEEGRTSRAKARLWLQAEEYEAIFADGPARLRLTLTLRDNA